MIAVGTIATNSLTRVWFGVPRTYRERALVFKLRRSDLKIEVDPRFNVRILELVDTPSGDRVELEGNWLPITHSGDVIKALTSD